MPKLYVEGSVDSIWWEVADVNFNTIATIMDFFVGVDVGTGSVRAALVTSNGKIKKVATCPLEVFNPAPNFYEQSSDNIWSAVCHVVKVGYLLKQFEKKERD